MKYSRQRKCIYDYLKSTKSHPTAEQVYENVSKEINNISLGTVYRNLDKMATSGDVLKLNVPGGRDRFDADISKHYHGVCINCNKVIDIDMPYLEELDSKVANKMKTDILFHHILFYITCNECNKK